MLSAGVCNFFKKMFKHIYLCFRNLSPLLTAIRNGWQRQNWHSLQDIRSNSILWAWRCQFCSTHAISATVVFLPLDVIVCIFPLSEDLLIAFRRRKTEAAGKRLGGGGQKWSPHPTQNPWISNDLRKGYILFPTSNLARCGLSFSFWMQQDVYVFPHLEVQVYPRGRNDGGPLLQSGECILSKGGRKPAVNVMTAGRQNWHPTFRTLAARGSELGSFCPI